MALSDKISTEARETFTPAFLRSFMARERKATMSTVIRKTIPRVMIRADPSVFI